MYYIKHIFKMAQQFKKFVLKYFKFKCTYVFIVLIVEYFERKIMGKVLFFALFFLPFMILQLCVAFVFTKV